MHTNTKKRSKRKSHVSSDEEEVLTISDEEVEFLDQGVVQKAKKPSARLRKVNAQTPCWKFFNIPEGNSQTGVIVTPHRAKLYPDHVEQ